jgi:hypothetical protein
VFKCHHDVTRANLSPLESPTLTQTTFEPDAAASSSRSPGYRFGRRASFLGDFSKSVISVTCTLCRFC